SFDTVSQAAFFAFAATRFGGLTQVLLIAGCFVAGMLMTDGLNGFWIARLIRRADRRAAIASRVMATAVGVVSLLDSGLTLVILVLPQAASWTDEKGLLIGVLVIAAMGLSFWAAMAAAKAAEALRARAD